MAKPVEWIKNRVRPAACAMRRDALSMLRAALGACLLFAAVLLLLPALAGRLGPEGVARLMNLFITLAFTPVFAALAATCLGAAWDRKTCSVKDAALAVWRNILRVLATGLCAWLLSLALEAVTGLVGSLTGLVSTLLGWIPGVGSVVNAIMAAVLFVAGEACAFAAHVALVSAMAALMLEGLWAMPQAKRALAILWGGRTDAFPALAMLLIAWLVVRAACALIAALAPALIAAVAVSLIDAALLTLATACILAVYLREKDRNSIIH